MKATIVLTVACAVLAVAVAGEGVALINDKDAIHRLNISTSTVGPQGPPGPAGPRGPAGPAGLQGRPGLNGQSASVVDTSELARVTAVEEMCESITASIMGLQSILQRATGVYYTTPKPACAGLGY